MGTSTIHIRRCFTAALALGLVGCGLAPIHRSREADSQGGAGRSWGRARAAALGAGQLHTLQDRPEVRERVSHLLGRGRGTLRVSLLRGLDLVPMIERELGAQGVPAELAYLPMVESRFRADAVGRYAVGLWQFTRATARRYGLRVDRGVDERRDPAKSSRAAARYLRDLYHQFESWDLALAAYNAGPARVQRALQRRPESTFFDLARDGLLPAVTRRYVPKVLAISLIGPRAESFGVHLQTRTG